MMQAFVSAFARCFIGDPEVPEEHWYYSDEQQGYWSSRVTGPGYSHPSLDPFSYPTGSDFDE